MQKINFVMCCLLILFFLIFPSYLLCMEQDEASPRSHVFSIRNHTEDSPQIYAYIGIDSNLDCPPGGWRSMKHLAWLNPAVRIKPGNTTEVPMEQFICPDGTPIHLGMLLQTYNETLAQDPTAKLSVEFSNYPSPAQMMLIEGQIDRGYSWAYSIPLKINELRNSSTHTISYPNVPEQGDIHGG